MQENENSNGAKMIEITPVKGFDATVAAPPSKAHTLRALFIASLANGRSVLKNALNAEDQQFSAAALRELGAGINFDVWFCNLYEYA